MESNQPLSLVFSRKALVLPMPECSTGVPKDKSQIKRDLRFSKSSRLLNSRQFRFKAFDRYRSRHFSFYYTKEGKGRLGVSLSKKVLKNSVARNRVRRLLREAFRFNKHRAVEIDVHVVGLSQLTKGWQSLTAAAVAKEFEGFFEKCGQSGKNGRNAGSSTGVQDEQSE